MGSLGAVVLYASLRSGLNSAKLDTPRFTSTGNINACRTQPESTCAMPWPVFIPAEPTGAYPGPLLYSAFWAPVPLYGNIRSRGIS